MDIICSVSFFFQEIFSERPLLPWKVSIKVSLDAVSHLVRSLLRCATRFAASLGIELTVESSATLHLSTRFDLDIADAAAYASLFGLMNIFSRGLGGYISDRMHKSYSLRGRLIIHMIFMFCEGILIFYFIRCSELHETLIAMVIFAIFGQVSS